SDIDAHSWVEAWFPDYGWVTFDPTPAASPARSQLINLSLPDATAPRGLGGAPPRRGDRPEPGPRAGGEGGGAGGVGVGALAALLAAAAALAGLGVLAVSRVRRRPVREAGGDPELDELRRALR